MNTIGSLIRSDQDSIRPSVGIGVRASKSCCTRADRDFANLAPKMKLSTAVRGKSVAMVMAIGLANSSGVALTLPSAGEHWTIQTRRGTPPQAAPRKHVDTPRKHTDLRHSLRVIILVSKTTARLCFLVRTITGNTFPCILIALSV